MGHSGIGDGFSGGAGNDRYAVNSAGDKIVENASEGSDGVFTTVGYTLDDNEDYSSLLFQNPLYISKQYHILKRRRFTLVFVVKGYP